MKLKNIKISSLLDFSLVSILILVIILGAIVFTNSSKLWQSTRDLYNHPLTVQNAIGATQVDILNIRLEMKELILEKDENARKAYIAAVEKFDSDSFSQLEILYNSYLGPKTDIDEAYLSILEYKVFRDKEIELIKIGKIEEANQSISITGAGRVQVEKIMEDLKVINDFARIKADSFYKEAENHRNQIITQTVIAISIMLLLAFVIIGLLKRAILVPLQELTNATSDFQSGKLGTRSHYESKNEFGDLSKVFNYMTETVEEENIKKEKRAIDLQLAKEQAETANVAIVKAWKYNRNLIEASLDPFVTIGPNGIINDVNKATENATGLSREILIGTSFSMYFTEPERAELGYEKVFKDGKVLDYELALKHINGSSIPVLYNASIYKDENGEVVGVFAVARDITKIRKFQSELIHLKNNLEAANKELEAFSYSVSHDLKAPIRHITGYASLLLKKYMNLLPEEGRGYLENISFSAQNMGELIDGLLQFSKTGRVEMKLSKIDMNEIIGKLIKPIIEQDIEHRIQFNIGKMPTAVGDLEMFTSVWSNFIENAIKFTKNKSIAEITIGAQESDDNITYFIRDNGAGFDMNYSAKLFTVFQRLHSREDYEGTGIGLATVRRIITRHGGKTWAESKIGEGATFYFSLLKRKESE
jgi:PAS domain S-box-containing protein